MAIVDRYVNATAEAGVKPFPSVNVAGVGMIGIATAFEIAAADDNTSVYRLFKSIPVTAVPVLLDINCDAITAGTDYDIGFYAPDRGVVIDKDALLDGADLSGGKAIGSEQSGLASLTVDLIGSSIADIILSKTGVAASYDAVDICLTGNVVGTSAGTVGVRAIFAQG